MAEYYTKQIAGFGPDYAPIDKLTFSGRYTDRRFLVQLDKAEWEKVTGEVVARLTDPVISEAVHRLPKEIYQKEGEGLTKSLRSRRDLLAAASRDYYRLLADRVDVRGSAKDEEIRIDRQAGGAVRSRSTRRIARPGRGQKPRTSTGPSCPRRLRRSASTRWAARTRSRSSARWTRPSWSASSRLRGASRSPT